MLQVGTKSTSCQGDQTQLSARAQHASDSVATRSAAAYLAVSFMNSVPVQWGAAFQSRETDLSLLGSPLHPELVIAGKYANDGCMV